MDGLPSGDVKLGKLVEATIGVLEQAGDADDLMELESTPTAVIAQQISTAAQGLGIPASDAARLADAATTPAQAAGVARAVLAELGRDEALREEIEDASQRRSDLMAIDPVTISVAVLLILVLRVRRVRISKQAGVDVQLDPLKADIVKAVLGFMGSPG